jgi:cytosine/adenosine deaminase-related metal-dependent hydrolase
LAIDSPPIEGGYVAVAKGKIAGVGAANPGVGAVTDLGDAVLMPGLVNTHTHLEFSAATQPLGAAGLSLPEWIRLVIADRKRGNRDAAAAISAGLRESLAAGVTTVGEIATGVPPAFDSVQLSPRTVTFQEAIGFSAGRVDSVYADVEQRLDGTPGLAGVSPHAPYTVHPALLKKLVALARRRHVPIAMHLAESREELELLQHGEGPFRELLEDRGMWDADAIPLGSRPLDYLKALVAAPRAVVIHGNYLDTEEIEFLAAHRDRMSVVFCPRTHAYFEHKPYPLVQLRKAGVRVALGTDSRASNPDLNLLAEARLMVEQFPQLAPAEALQMATLSGAEALGVSDVTGSMTPGKQADLAAFAISQASTDPHEEVLSSREPLAVWLAGLRLTTALGKPF